MDTSHDKYACVFLIPWKVQLFQNCLVTKKIICYLSIPIRRRKKEKEKR